MIMFVGGYSAGTVYKADIYQWEEDKQEWVLTARMIKARYYHAVSIVSMDDDLINYCN